MGFTLTNSDNGLGHLLCDHKMCEQQDFVEESETSAARTSSSDDTTTTTSSSHHKHAHAYRLNMGRRLIQASRVPKATFGVVANAESASRKAVNRWWEEAAEEIHNAEIEDINQGENQVMAEERGRNNLMRQGRKDLIPETPVEVLYIPSSRLTCWVRGLTLFRSQMRLGKNTRLLETMRVEVS